MTSLAFFPAGTTFGAGFGSGESWVFFDAATFGEVGELEFPTGGHVLARAPDGRRVAIQGKEGKKTLVKIYHIETGELQTSFVIEDEAAAGYTRPVPVGFSPNGELLAVNSWKEPAMEDGYVDLWDVASLSRILRCSGTAGFSGGFAEDGRTMVTFSREGVSKPGVIVKLWDIPVREQETPSDTAISETRPGGLDSSDFRLLPADLGSLATVLAPVRALSFSPDGKTLAAGILAENPYRQETVFWDTVTWQERLRAEEAEFKEFSYDGTLFATSTDLRDAASGAVISTIKAASVVAFFPRRHDLGYWHWSRRAHRDLERRFESIGWGTAARRITSWRVAPR